MIKTSNDCIEQESVSVLIEAKDQNQAGAALLYSIAISLKRMADRLDEVIDYRFDEPAIRTRKGTL